MGNHSSVRAGSVHRHGWRLAAIVGVGVGFVSATVAGIGLASGTTSPTPSVYSAITPVTVLARSLAADSNTDVTVAGVDGVPSNATSVQLSVTALSGTTTSSMYVYPTGATKPSSANVRWQTGQTITIPVTVAVGTSGKIHLSTDAGTVTVKVALVGYFSPAPITTASAYSTSGVIINDDTDGLTTVASLDVPAGTYDVRAKATIVLNAGSSEYVSCYLADPSDDTIDSSSSALDADIDESPMSMEGLDTTSGGTMTFLCDDLHSDAGANNVELVAIPFSSATGDVTGG
jgi:hypothetical protein